MADDILGNGSGEQPKSHAPGHPDGRFSPPGVASERVSRPGTPQRATGALVPDPDASRGRGFSAVRSAPRSPGRAIGWPDVLRAVQSDAARSEAMGHYRAAGYSPDDFGRLRGAREAMAGALTRAEDTLEFRRGARLDAERDAIRAVRRRLEDEIR